MRLLLPRLATGLYLGAKVENIPACRHMRFTGISIGRLFVGLVVDHQEPEEPAPDSADKHWMRQKAGQPGERMD